MADQRQVIDRQLIEVVLRDVLTSFGINALRADYQRTADALAKLEVDNQLSAESNAEALRRLQSVDLALASVTQNLLSLQSKTQSVDSALASVTQNLLSLQSKTSGLDSRVASVKKNLDALQSKTASLHDRVTDIDSGHRSMLRAARSAQHRASGLSPTGSAFSERDADFRPPSIFAQ